METILADGKLALGLLAALLGVLWHVQRFKRDHDRQLSDLVAWRTRKDEADKRHDAELDRMREEWRDREAADNEKWTRVFAKLDKLAEDVAWLKAHVMKNGGGR